MSHKPRLLITKTGDVVEITAWPAEESVSSLVDVYFHDYDTDEEILVPKWREVESGGEAIYPNEP